LLEKQQCNPIDANFVLKLDGNEIVSEVINEMKKEEKENSTNKLSKELLKLDDQYTNGSKSVGNRSRHGSISSLAEVMCSPSPNLMSPSPLSPMLSSSNFEEKLAGHVNGNSNVSMFNFGNYYIN
jgi:hypothetical protein